ncbi:MAG: toll/interleukin-1 receptor domain-containing protein [Gammaproteobacteria bacterium]
MGRIFISYRRDDCAADANALYQSLAAEFDKESIFKDVDDVELGANWKTAIQKAVQKSSVLLLLMGSKWQYSGAIQIEVESALDTGVPMIPLLVKPRSPRSSRLLRGEPRLSATSTPPLSITQVGIVT